MKEILKKGITVSKKDKKNLETEYLGGWKDRIFPRIRKFNNNYYMYSNSAKNKNELKPLLEKLKKDKIHYRTSKGKKNGKVIFRSWGKIDDLKFFKNSSKMKR